MIRYLRGTLLERLPGEVIVDVGGVGYRVFVPDSFKWDGASRNGEIRLYIHTHVREDAIQLYGFQSREELSMFETLLGVSGVGPRLGLAIVSHLSPQALARAVMNGEERALTKVPGVGKKMAARVVLELKDKLKGMGSDSRGENAPHAVDGAGALVQDAVAALVALGFTEDVASDAVRQAAASSGASDIEGLIKAALKRLDRGG